MMPEGTSRRIRSVHIHYGYASICGFQFYDKEGALIWKIGRIFPGYYVGKVLIEENEVIVGVVCKLASGCQCRYTDF